MDKKKFFKKFPKTKKCKLECHADFVSSTCVWDEGKPEDCLNAWKGIKKENCPEWKKQPPSQAYYTSEEIWKWIEKNG